MIQTDKLRGIIAENGYSQADMAHAIGVTPKTFYNKMKKGVFRSNEIQILIEKLNITDPGEIFFTRK